MAGTWSESGRSAAGAHKPSHVNAEGVIAGAGPAGCATALQLAQRGCAVALIAHPVGRGELGEMLVPRGARLVEALGLRLEHGTSHARAPGIICAWGEAEPAWHEVLDRL